MGKSIWFTLVVLGSMAGSVQAEVNAITPDPSPTLGNMLVCTALNDGNSPVVTGWSWSVQLQHGGQTYQTGFMDKGGGTVWIPATSPGVLIVNCTVSYTISSTGPPPNPPPPNPKLLTINITVAPPDSMNLIVGVPVTLNYTQSTTIVWEVLAGGKTCGGHMAGMAQESKTNWFNWDGTRLPASGWIPTTPTSSFYLSTGRIIDVQGIVPGSWSLIQVGQTCTWDQEQGILFQYPDGSWQRYSVGTRHFTTRKVDSTNWSDSCK